MKHTQSDIKRIAEVIKKIDQNWKKFAPLEIYKNSNVTFAYRLDVMVLVAAVNIGDYYKQIDISTTRFMVEELVNEFCTHVVRDLLYAVATRHLHGAKKVATEPTIDTQIKELCSKSTSSIEFCLFKLQEELGEVAKAYNQPKRCDEPLENELVDLILVAKDALYKVQRYKQLSDKDIDGVFKMKMDKWKKNVGIA